MFFARTMSQIISNASVLFFAFALVSGSAKADSSDGQVDYRDTPWANGNEYQDCGQGCIFEKGNEVLTLDATYTVEKIARVKEMETDAEIFDTLSGFCREGEDAQDCKDRYVAVATRSLYESRTAMGKNQSSAYSLSNHKGTASKPDFRKPGLKPQVASVITWDRVKEKINSRKARVRSQEQWVRDVAPQPPNINDFVVFKAMPRDPADPGAGSFMVPDTSPQGLAKQKKAYDEAMKAYEERIADFKQQWADSAVVKNYKPDAAERSVAPEKGSTEYKAFEAARRNVIGAVNSRLEDLGMVSKKAPASPARSVASDKPGSKVKEKDKNVGVNVTQTQKKAAQVNPADDPANDFVRPVESSDERNDFVTYGWDPDRLTDTATGGMRKPGSATPTPGASTVPTGGTSH